MDACQRIFNQRMCYIIEIIFFLNVTSHLKILYSNSPLGMSTTIPIRMKMNPLTMSTEAGAGGKWGKKYT